MTAATGPPGRPSEDVWDWLEGSLPAVFGDREAVRVLGVFALTDESPVTPAAIAEAADVDEATVREVADRLVAIRALVEDEDPDDGLIYHVDHDDGVLLAMRRLQTQIGHRRAHYG